MTVKRVPTLGDDDRLSLDFLPDLTATDVGADPAGAATAAQAAAATDATTKADVARSTAISAATAQVDAHELATDPHGDRAAATTALTGHAADTTAVHGITDTALLETTTGAQTKATAAQTAAATDATTKAAAAQAAAVQRANHTGTQSADSLTDGTTNKAFLATERTKLTGVATSATANSTDAQLRDRGTHTGTQAAGTITGLGTAATLNVGTATGTVMAGDDTRLFAAGRRNLAGGRQIIATRLGGGSGSLQPSQNTPLKNRIMHVALANCSGVRLAYGITANGLQGSGPNQPVNIKAGLEYPAGTTYKVTFSARQQAVIEPYGLVQLSDPIPVDLVKGDVFYSRSFESTDWGYTPLAASITAGANSFQVTTRPGTPKGLVTIESPREVVEVAYWEGTANPYTVYLKSGTTVPSSHSSGAVAGGTVYANFTTRGDLGDQGVVSSVDDSWTTLTFGYSGSGAATTLAANVTIGDLEISTVGNLTTGDTITIDGEALTVRNIYGTANPYKIQLTAAATANHTSGASVTSVVSTGSGLAPILIVADKVGTNYKGTIATVGDSIVSGVGTNKWPGSFAVGDHGAIEEAGFACLNLSLAGEAMYQFVVATTSAGRRQQLALADWMLFEYGVNDAYGGRTSAQMIADATSILTYAKSIGVKTMVTTLTPRTTTTDQWKTVGNQTILTPGFASTVLTYNAWVRAGAAGLADKVVELADASMTARDSNIWKADASGPYTTDGIHPTSAGYQLLLKPALAAVLATI